MIEIKALINKTCKRISSFIVWKIDYNLVYADNKLSYKLI